MKIIALGSLKKNVLTFYPKRPSVLNHITGRNFFSSRQKIFFTSRIYVNTDILFYISRKFNSNIIKQKLI